MNSGEGGGCEWGQRSPVAGKDKRGRVVWGWGGWSGGGVSWGTRPTRTATVALGSVPAQSVHENTGR